MSCPPRSPPQLSQLFPAELVVSSVGLLWHLAHSIVKESTRLPSESACVHQDTEFIKDKNHTLHVTAFTMPHGAQYMSDDETNERKNGLHPPLPCKSPAVFLYPFSFLPSLSPTMPPPGAQHIDGTRNTILLFPLLKYLYPCAQASQNHPQPLLLTTAHRPPTLIKTLILAFYFLMMWTVMRMNLPGSQHTSRKLSCTSLNPQGLSFSSVSFWLIHIHCLIPNLFLCFLS